MREKTAASNVMDKINDQFTAGKLRVFLALVYAALLIPMLYLGKYDYPSIDDFSEGYTVWEAFSEGGAAAVIPAAFRHVITDYFHWIGYYSNTFVSGLQPGNFGTKCYAVTPYILLGFLTAGVIFLMRSMFSGIFGIRREYADCTSLIILIIMTQDLEGANEAFYWYAGGINYTFFFAVAMIYLALMVILWADLNERSGKHGSRRRRAVLCAAASFLGFFVAGGNYMTVLSIAVSLACAPLLVKVFSGAGQTAEKRDLLNRFRGCIRKNAVLIIPAVFFYAGFVISCLSPGNLSRGESVGTGMGAAKSIFVSLYYFFDYCVSERTGWPVLFGLLLLIPVYIRAAERTRFSFRYPVLVFLFGFGLASANITPPLYAVGNIEAGRLKALIFMQYILIMAVCEFYAVGYVVKRRRYRLPAEGDAADKRLRLPGAGIFAALCLFICFGCALSVKADPYSFTSSAACADILNGNAAAYAEAMDERFAVFEDDSVKDVVFDRLPVEPLLLYYDDFMEDTENWRNRAAARYYNKDSVSVPGRYE